MSTYVKLESLGNGTEGVGSRRNGGRSNRLSPCRQRRRERREAERKAKSDASEEVAYELAETVGPRPVVSEYEVFIDVPKEVKKLWYSGGYRREFQGFIR